MTFGGVAWAQNRGVRAVEVRIDEGDWQPADARRELLQRHLAAVELRVAGHRPGLHTITVRATDNTGAVQTAELADPVPDGATGWHTVSFAVEWLS